jgi:hypothetical protein
VLKGKAVEVTNEKIFEAQTNRIWLEGFYGMISKTSIPFIFKYPEPVKKHQRKRKKSRKIRRADGARMCEKAEMLSDTGVMSNGVVEEKSLVGTRCFAIYVFQLLRFMRWQFV